MGRTKRQQNLNNQEKTFANVIEIPKCYLRSSEAAKYLGISVQTLETFRKRRLISFFESESGSLYYSIKELDDFITSKYIPSDYQVQEIINKRLVEVSK